MNNRSLNIRSIREGRTSREARDSRKLRCVKILVINDANLPRYSAELTHKDEKVINTQTYTGARFIKRFSAYYFFMDAAAKTLFDALKLNPNSPPVTPPTTPRQAQAQSSAARGMASPYSSGHTVFNSRSSALSQVSNRERLIPGQEDGNVRLKKSG
jgi:hypothetical protein